VHILRFAGGGVGERRRAASRQRRRSGRAESSRAACAANSPSRRRARAAAHAATGERVAARRTRQGSSGRYAVNRAQTKAQESPLHSVNTTERQERWAGTQSALAGGEATRERRSTRPPPSFPVARHLTPGHRRGCSRLAFPRHAPGVEQAVLLARSEQGKLCRCIVRLPARVV
jgi:hypothetical protein